MAKSSFISLFVLSFLVIGLPAIAAKQNKKTDAAKKSDDVAAPAAKRADEVRTTGTLYPLKSSFDQPLYRYERVSRRDSNGKSVTVKFTELDGRLILEETVDYNPAGDFIRFRRNHPQIDEITLVERRDKQVFFRREFKGAVKEATEKWDENYISNDQLPPLIEKHWDALAGGQEMNMRLMVPSRVETIGFTVEKLKKKGELKGEPMDVFEMTPSSMLIRSFVEPIHFYYSAKNRKLRWISGRMPVKRIDNKGKYHDLEAELLFD